MNTIAQRGHGAIIACIACVAVANSLHAKGCRSSGVEHFIGNEEVGGSIPPGSTISRKFRIGAWPRHWPGLRLLAGGMTLTAAEYFLNFGP